MKKLVFTFKEDGSVSVDAQGYQGPSCVQDTEKILSVLDAELENRRVKGEFYAHAAQKTQSRSSVQR